MGGNEIELFGGLINKVVRVGDTVRRTMSRDRTTAHHLLRHLETRGFEGAPRFLGVDALGREILTYLPSDLKFDAASFSDDQLTAAAALLRSFHEATLDFALVVEAGAEVLCHNDWTPANTGFRNAIPYGMIDFDTVAPGTRLWDVSYSAWTWLDLSDPAFSADEQLRRLELFCSGYDHPSCTVAHLAGYIPTRQAGRARWAKDRNMPEAEAWALKCMYWTVQNLSERVHRTGLPET
ncbi:phosphotransferase [Devosia marina]|uniref:Phosphotransferase n=1 Tax=Devosia marina TaxID=2683198 RepID=A0A7X3FR16_9HYPH|nr:phosphotransferase [Devosia marina]MVS99025.1 phosphotransferase [Devosia marina]